MSVRLTVYNPPSRYAEIPPAETHQATVAHNSSSLAEAAPISTFCLGSASREDSKQRTTTSTRDSLDKMYVDVTLPAWSCSTISSASDADADMVVCCAVLCLWGAVVR